nr:ribonuclease H-like domain-containing protein [Tanacetum cinerariifolium]
MIKDVAGNEVEVLPVIAQQILVGTRERKAKSTLLMAIPDEHLARFYGIKYAKTLWAAIKTRFSGVSTEDANQKFLRSLPSAWSNISLIMRNKPGIDNLDIDDLYNNLKVYEADIKGSSGSSSNSQNAIVLRHKVAMLSMMMKRFYKKTKRKLEFNGKEPVGLDKTKVECFNCHKRGYFVRDCRTARNLGNRGRDAGNARYRGRDNGKRPAKEEDEKTLLDEASREKEDLKAKIENSKTSKNLTKLLNSQITAKVKTGLGDDSQFNEKEVLDVKEKEVTETLFDNRSSDEEKV